MTCYEHCQCLLAVRGIVFISAPKIPPPVRELNTRPRLPVSWHAVMTVSALGPVCLRGALVSSLRVVVLRPCQHRNVLPIENVGKSPGQREDWEPGSIIRVFASDGDCSRVRPPGHSVVALTGRLGSCQGTEPFSYNSAGANLARSCEFGKTGCWPDCVGDTRSLEPERRPRIVSGERRLRRTRWQASTRPQGK
jgi:hypothetical protein